MAVLLTCCCAEFGPSRSKSVRMQIRMKAWAPRVPPFKVTQGHRNRYGSIYDPVSNPYSDSGSISYCFRDKCDFSDEKRKLVLYSVYLTPPWNFATPDRLKNYNDVSTKRRKQFEDSYSSTIQYQHWTDGRTGGQKWYINITLFNAY